MTDRSEYPNILRKLQPAQAVDVLNDRVRQVTRLNTSIADWLAERRRLEDQYAAGLKRLARQQVDESDLGIFSVPWSTIASSMDTLADSHAFLATKINVDIERPLREFATSNREMTAMTTIQGNLASLAKDVDRAQQKTDKLENKGGRAETNRVANASSDLENARAQWDSQAPYVFETLQAIDEFRTNLLRDLLTQFQTFEVDLVEKNRVGAEQCLNVLLNVETQDEIKTFALRSVAAPKPPASRARPASMLPSALTPSRSAGGSSSNALAPIPDDRSTHSGTQEKEKKGGFKGLKRLGTVISRRQSKQPMPLPSSAEEAEKKRPFGRLGRNKESYSLDTPQEEDDEAERPSSVARAGSRTLHSAELPAPEPARGIRTSSLQPLEINGIGGAGALAFEPAINGGHTNDLAGLQPPPPTQQSAAFPRQDSEGFSVPPTNIDPISAAHAEAEAALTGDPVQPAYNVNIRNAPIQDEGENAALADVAAKLQGPPVNVRRVGTVRGRRDARNSVIQADPATPTGPLPPIPAVTPDLTGSSSIHKPLPDPSPLTQSPSGILTPASGASVPVAGFAPIPTEAIRTPAKAIATTDGTAADTQSIRSARSQSSAAGQVNKHPDLTQPGLSSSIIETISARFENGAVTSSSLIGEIAFAYNPTDSSAAPAQETIRLENFSTLEKVAPNPALIHSNATSHEGEYHLNIPSITSPRPQVAFKYQLRPDPTAPLFTPIHITPAFKIEPTQTSVILSYSFPTTNPSLLTNPITLSRVHIILTLDAPARATACLSKPVGTFARDKNLIYWSLGDVTLRPGAAPEKLLARFTTESVPPAHGGTVEVKWEVAGSEALGYGSGIAVDVVGGARGGADPFADEDGWRRVGGVKKIVSGSYIAN